MTGLCIRFFWPFGLQASPFDVFHALTPLLTYMLRMLPEVWFEPKETVVRLEVECDSTRSRLWFDSKQRVFRLEARQPDSHPFVASRRSGGRRTAGWLPESRRIICHG